MNRLILFLLIFLSCESSIEIDETYLYIETYEVIQGTNNAYAHVYYNTKPPQRVFWTSPDTVIVDDIKSCIICCSTYSDKNGEGQQLALLPYNYNKKSWTIIGYINEEISDTIIIK